MNWKAVVWQILKSFFWFGVIVWLFYRLPDHTPHTYKDFCPILGAVFGWIVTMFNREDLM